MHSAHLTSSPDSSILAGDVFFHFLPAACAGYPFWSCIPGCDHSKLHGKFSFHFNFPPGIPPLSRANTLFSFSFLRRGLTLSPLLCLGRCIQNLVNPPQCCMDFFFFFCLFGVFWGLLVLFYSSHTHILFQNLLCLWVICLPAVPMCLLWCYCDLLSVCVCWWPCMWNVEGFLVKCSKSRKPHIRPSLSTNEKLESATCLVFVSPAMLVAETWEKEIVWKVPTGRGGVSALGEQRCPPVMCCSQLMRSRLCPIQGMGREVSDATETGLAMQKPKTLIQKKRKE